MKRQTRGFIQRSVSGGIIGRPLDARSDTTKVANGLRTADNFVVTRFGSAQNRTGTRYIAPLKTGTDKARMLRFKFNDQQVYELEFGAGYIRLSVADSALATGSVSDWSDATEYEVGDLVVDGAAGGNTGTTFYCTADHTSSGGDNGPHDSDGTGTETDILTQFWYALDGDTLEVPTPYSIDDVPDLRFAQSGDIVIVTHRDHPQHRLIRLSATKWEFLPVPFKPTAAPPTGLRNDNPSGSSVANGDTSGSRRVRYMVTAVDAETETESLPGRNNTTVAGRGLANQTSTTSPLKITGTAHGVETGDEVFLFNVASDTPLTQANQNAKVMLEDTVWTVTDDPDNPGDDLLLDESTGLLVSPSTAVTYPDVEVEWAVAFLEFPSIRVPGTSSGNVDIMWNAPADTEVREYRIYRSVDKGPYGFIYSVKDTYFRDGEVDNESDLTITPPIFSNPFRSGTWPRCVGFYQQRTVYAGSNTYPRRTWLSVSGDFNNFGRHDPVLDDDRVIWTVRGEEANEIVGLADLGQLIVLTNGAVWTAVGDQDETITPTAVNPRALAYDGASAIDPALLGDTIFYPHAYGEQVREIRFNIADGGASGFLGRDMTVFAPELFQGYEIVDWDVAEVPQPTLYLVRSDGCMLVMTYSSEQALWSWTKLSTDGDYLSVTVTPEENQDLPTVIVSRFVDGSTVYYKERLAPRVVGYFGYDPRIYDVFLDSYLSYDGTHTAATTSMTLTGGMTWAVGETGLTLTASAATFAGDATDVGKGYRLRVTATDKTMYEVEVQVTAGTSTTVQAVTILAARTVAEGFASFTDATTVASGLQAVATTDWVAMVTTVSGLSHLEGKTVGILADGNDLGTQVVTSGALPTALSRPYGVIHVGLPYEARAQTLDLDVVQSDDAVFDQIKDVIGGSVLVNQTIGLKMGSDPETAETIEGLEVVPLAYQTGKFQSRPRMEATDHGRIWLIQDAPFPAEIGAIVTHASVTGRGA